jgi:hypothetical protein
MIGLMRRLAAVLVAALAGLGASELILRHYMHDPATFLGLREVGLTVADPSLGWRFIPRHHAALRHSGRLVDYRIDGNGNRAPGWDQVSDPGRPSILFLGESIMAGWGLFWEETIAARLGRRTGLQPVNLAVFGYGNDQAMRRLEQALPSFGQARYVVSLVNVLQLERNTRPWQRGFALGGEGNLLERGPSLGFWSHLRLRVIWNQLPIHRRERIELAGALLGRTATCARAAGARPLFVVPSYGPPRAHRQHAEAAVLDQVFAAAGVDYLLVDIDPRLRLDDAWHPDAQGADVLAQAIAAAL